MATKQEIIDGINAGIQRVDVTFSTLSDEQLQRKVHHGENGWTAKEILAHLAGRKAGYDRIVQTVKGGPVPSASQFNVDDWNRQSVAQRIEKSRDELLDEFRSVHEGLIGRVRELDDDLLGRTIELPVGSVALGDVLMRSGGMHSINHSAEVEQALGLSAPNS